MTVENYRTVLLKDNDGVVVCEYDSNTKEIRIVGFDAKITDIECENYIRFFQIVKEGL